jgi:Xaa-Pro dipeptidase
LIRPGDQAYFDIIHVFNGYRTCYYRTFVVGRATQAQRDAFKRSREWMDAAIDLVKPGQSTDVIAAVWPKAEDFGFVDEMDAFGLQFGHGVGVSLHERWRSRRACCSRSRRTAPRPTAGLRLASRRRSS